MCTYVSKVISFIQILCELFVFSMRATCPPLALIDVFFRSKRIYTVLGFTVPSTNLSIHKPQSEGNIKLWPFRV
jgi:hypothetical protein